MPSDFKWHEITDLPEDFDSLTSHELRPLHEIWIEQKGTLVERGAMEEFHLRLKREWAVETGAIEGVYTLDRGVTQTLIERGIIPSLIPKQAGGKTPEHVAAIIQDQEQVLDWLFDYVKGARALSTSFIKELHSALLRHQEHVEVEDQFGNRFEKTLQKGTYKTSANNPRREDGTVFEYCPPEHLAAEMDRLVAWHADHQTRGVAPEVEAAWLHHRFTLIHPFEDGNGRVARAIASLVFIKAGWFPLIIRNTEERSATSRLWSELTWGIWDR
jgi:Fic family protein